MQRQRGDRKVGKKILQFTAANAGNRVPFREDRYSKVMHHRLLHRVGVVDQERAADRGDMAAMLGFERPFIGGRKARIDDASMSGEIIRRSRRNVIAKIGRRCNQIARHGAKATGNQRACLELSDPHCQFNSFLDQAFPRTWGLGELLRAIGRDALLDALLNNGPVES